ncbi:DNA-binding XRE family transcriptional regulator [Curtobacterium flaccumfaciens]|uniref:DNA-binding XRE family transcriptional regulator n=1 Tax=Curtobacterium flaccumfaciens TaxID=2035 RepID=A0A4R6DII9_9MICO|nr:helix-turn-helix domain-containing protein [Curtobacterium flaccumfaciens]TDN43959.1 DNA-binding XRE family transcriptional regulator [Curtobacterium flaccumfaciens]
MASNSVYSLAQLGAALKTARLKRGQTQAAIADLAGVQRQWLVQLENGRLPNPSLQKVFAVVETLGLTLALADDDDGADVR